LPSIQEQDMWFGVFYVVQYGLLLNIKEPFIYQLVAVLADQMGEVFLKSENNKV
jgi:alanyl-tRNA synthetase